MNLNELGLNRLLNNEGASLSDDAVVSRSLNTNTSSGLDEANAPGILTGTVITACLFRSTDQSNKIEIKNNDMTLYDASAGGTGAITGDTSSIVFLRADGLPGEFLIQKRKSINSNLGNVFEMFYSEDASGVGKNYIFIGREGQGDNTSSHVNELVLHADDGVRFEINRVHNYINRPTVYSADLAPLTGGDGIITGIYGEGPDGFSTLSFMVEVLFFTGTPDFHVGDTITGNSTGATALITKVYTASIFLADHTSYDVDFSASDNACTTDGVGGGTGTGVFSSSSFTQWDSIFTDHTLNAILGTDFLPYTDSTYDIGSPTKKIKTLYVDSIVGGFLGAFNFNTTFECLDSYTQTVNGAGGAISNASGYLSLLTGATATNNVIINRSTISPMSWDKDRTLKSYIVVPNTAQISAFFGNGDFSSFDTRHIGFGITSGGVLTGWVANGTSNSNITFSATATSGVPLALEYRLVAGTSVEFFVDGVSQGTVTTNIPSGATSAEVLMYFKVNATADVAKEVDMGYYDFKQEN